MFNPDVQVVISDGLSTDAITVNYEEILPPLMAGLKQAGLKVGTPFFVRYGRVKIEDQIGEILGAKVVILLVGERPGLGQSESLSCYAVYSPRMATTVEADRTCILTFTVAARRRLKPQPSLWIWRNVCWSRKHPAST